VVGCGGLGTHGIQLAKMMGAAFVVAIDTDAHARERAMRLGADLALDPKQDDVRRSITAAVPGGLDLVLECVGSAVTVQLALRCLGKRGRAVIVGVGTERAQLPPLAAFVGREQAVLGSFGMDRADIEDLYRLIATRRLDLSGSISARYSLERANDALQHLARKDDGVVRVVVEPQVH